MITIYRAKTEASNTARDLINANGWEIEATANNSFLSLFCLKFKAFDIEDKKAEFTSLFTQCLKDTSIMPVATVDTDDLEQAFEKSNTIFTHWSENEEVTMLESSKDAFLSSTSVGDVLQTNDGVFHLVCGCGFTTLQA